MNRYRGLLATLLLSLLMAGCATLQPTFEPPTVNVTRFELLPGSSLVPRFQIGLHVANPNRTALELEGLSYTVNIEGHRILTGVSNRLPLIEPYGEAEIEVIATTSLLNSIRLFTDLLHGNRENVDYELVMKLDPGGVLPPVRVTDRGSVALGPAQN